MENQTGKLGIREYTAIAIFVIGSRLTDDTVALIYEPLQNASWMLPIVSGGIFFVPLFLLLKTLTLYKNKKSIYCNSTITWKISLVLSFAF